MSGFREGIAEEKHKVASKATLCLAFLNLGLNRTAHKIEGRSTLL